ncbi:PIN domain-containing protein [Myxococcus sp. MISCRS1]|uniref:PIN domain-containing protein n=1 Tax=Myxococcus sp. MISCRS1 TaxID=2996786 RepID=UPI0022716181|nr:PIN domain-containing protein [Myxococcus sp. MISCRS1]MCY0997918.1 PIN domain-containing protein [Myxococcus sp. MISCRS1]
MASDKSDGSPGSEMLILNSVYRHPESIFSFRPRPLQEIKPSAIVVLDTNVLLVPFKTGKDSLVQIRKVYEALISEKRLVIPGQVAREFARNRSDRLKELYQQINRRRLVLPEAAYPLLENSPQYREMKRLEVDLLVKLREHAQAVDLLLEEIKGWHWNDPVSALYQDLFGAGVVLESSNRSEREVAVEVERRYAHDLPPGYKDKNKADRGVGDYLIWSTILEVGRARGVDTIFVSADRKSDWWIQSEGSPLYPRFELIEEYRHATDGKNIHIIDFATLLRMFGATKEVVAEVQSKEVPLTPVASAVQRIRRLSLNMEVKARRTRAVMKWLRGWQGVDDVELISETSNRQSYRMIWDVRMPPGNARTVFVGYPDNVVEWEDIRDLAEAAESEEVFGTGGQVVLVFDDPFYAEISSVAIDRLASSSVPLKVHVGTIVNDVFELVSY